MKRIIMSVDWLIDFFEKEGAEAYNSLVISNNLATKGEVLIPIVIKLEEYPLKKWGKSGCCM